MVMTNNNRARRDDAKIEVIEEGKGGCDSDSFYSHTSFMLICPYCEKDITEELKEKLIQITGLTEKTLKDITVEQLKTFVLVGKQFLEFSGPSYKKYMITEKTSERVIELVKELMEPKLRNDEKEKYENEIKSLRDMIEGMKDHIQERDKQLEKIEFEYSDLKARVTSNPSIKGALAESELFEDLEGNFPDQNKQFIDISKEGHGDILWKNVQINLGGWIDSHVGVIIDSKDKNSVTEEDIEKLKEDMQFHKKNLGMIIVKKQDQLRLKERPAGIYSFDRGCIIVVSRENMEHHVALMFLRDILVPYLYKIFNKEIDQNQIDIPKLRQIFIDIMKFESYHKKIKKKASGIILDIEEEEIYIKEKLKEAWEILKFDKNPENS
jgi:predicted RNase H-like nuclease (RuvC/YqgF family)